MHAFHMNLTINIISFLLHKPLFPTAQARQLVHIWGMKMPASPLFIPHV